MHTCLNVDEIIRLITRELVASDAKATAVSLACCRKDFEDPVLDNLWGTQDQLLPLFESLPGDVWNGGGYTSFKRFPTTLEWARFRKYAQRIRKLEVGTTILLSSKVLSVLQLCAFSEPFFPNLESLRLEFSSAKLAPLIPLVLSPKTTVIDITFNVSDFPEAIVASMITAFPSLCPNLQDITLHLLPKSPAIIAVVSRMLLASNQNALRRCYVNLPLTEEAREVIFKLPDLRKLSMVIERDALPSPVVLPNLTHLFIGCDHGGGWLRFLRGATFGKLEAACFASGPGQIGDFLEEFERIALAASAQHTLSYFHLDTLCSWNPNYSSLLPFTQLTDLGIGFPCNDGCSSSVDDDTITNLARVMPKLEILHLGGPPCREIPIGVTVKGLAILANHCPHLYDLRVHFQVTSLSAPPAIAGATSGAGFATIQGDCFLTELKVGEIPMAEESVLVVALTLAHIFPLIENIDHVDENWGKVMNAINLSRQIVGYAGATSEDGG